jgi:signal recognition particle subunit SEC65
MAIELITLWGHTERPWGYEVRAILREVGKTEDINVEMTFPQEPTQQEIDDMVAVKKVQVEAQLAEEVAQTLPQFSITCEDNVVIEV